jgi:hypothetical protein
MKKTEKRIKKGWLKFGRVEKEFTFATRTIETAGNAERVSG